MRWVRKLNAVREGHLWSHPEIDCSPMIVRFRSRYTRLDSTCSHSLVAKPGKGGRWDESRVYQADYATPDGVPSIDLY